MVTRFRILSRSAREQKLAGVHLRAPKRCRNDIETLSCLSPHHLTCDIVYSSEGYGWVGGWIRAGRDYIRKDGWLGKCGLVWLMERAGTLVSVKFQGGIIRGFDGGWGIYLGVLRVVLQEVLREMATVTGKYDT